MNRTFAAGLLSIALLPGLAACGAGFDPETQYVEADNANGEVNDVLARAIVIVKGKASQSAAVAGTLINRSERSDVLTTITLTDVTPGSPTITLSPNLPLAPGQLVPLGVGEFKPITVPDARSLNVGNFVDVVLTFKAAGPLKLEVATEDRTLFYEDVTPETSPAPLGQAKQKIETGAGAEKVVKVAGANSVAAPEGADTRPSAAKTAAKKAAAATKTAAKKAATKPNAKKADAKGAAPSDGAR